ncbi:hypothetical protein TNCT_261161 [Trichonephila clavata]|uniref:Uncharacterized protein n=1 Tax=Trichonephila clavata TaxID=2740835 RepID=A0A8X6KX17_TRICU|nr:hypothetical protein TNCT_261161 [Trichonephila clavata]
MTIETEMNRLGNKYSTTSSALLIIEPKNHVDVISVARCTGLCLSDFMTSESQMRSSSPPPRQSKQSARSPLRAIWEGSNAANLLLA